MKIERSRLQPGAQEMQKRKQKRQEVESARETPLWEKLLTTLLLAVLYLTLAAIPVLWATGNL